MINWHKVCGSNIRSARQDTTDNCNVQNYKWKTLNLAFLKNSSNCSQIIWSRRTHLLFAVLSLIIHKSETNVEELKSIVQVMWCSLMSVGPDHLAGGRVWRCEGETIISSQPLCNGHLSPESDQAALLGGDDTWQDYVLVRQIEPLLGLGGKTNVTSYSNMLHHQHSFLLSSPSSQLSVRSCGIIIKKSRFQPEQQWQVFVVALITK